MCQSTWKSFKSSQLLRLLTVVYKLRHILHFRLLTYHVCLSIMCNKEARVFFHIGNLLQRKVWKVTQVKLQVQHCNSNSLPVTVLKRSCKAFRQDKYTLLWLSHDYQSRHTSCGRGNQLLPDNRWCWVSRYCSLCKSATRTFNATTSMNIFYINMHLLHLSVDKLHASEFCSHQLRHT